MNAPILVPTLLDHVRADAISVAVIWHSDYRHALAGALVWERAAALDVDAAVYAGLLREELAAMGVAVEVPLLTAEPSGLASRYTLRWRVSRMIRCGISVYHGIEIEYLPLDVLPYKLRLGSLPRAAQLDDVERAAYEMLRAAGRLGAEPTDAVVARVREIRDVTAMAKRR